MSLKYRFVLKVNVEVEKRIEVGQIPAGLRRVNPITGGTFHGPNRKGTVLAGRADYQVIRNDG